MAAPSGDLYKNCGSAQRHSPWLCCRSSPALSPSPPPQSLLTSSPVAGTGSAPLSWPAGGEICGAPKLLGKSRAAVRVGWVWRTESRRTGGWLCIRRVWAWLGGVEVMRSLRSLRCSQELFQGLDPSPSQVDLVTVVG